MSRTAADLQSDELAALALLVERHRTRTGHSPWDPGTIAAQLSQLEHDLPTALAIALNAASDPAANTPHALTWARHQPSASTNSTTSGARPPSGPSCSTCHLPEQACRRLAARTNDPHTFTSRSTR